jgi:hypothetical protein
MLAAKPMEMMFHRLGLKVLALGSQPTQSFAPIVQVELGGRFLAELKDHLPSVWVGGWHRKD